MESITARNQTTSKTQYTKKGGRNESMEKDL